MKILPYILPLTFDGVTKNGNKLYKLLNIKDYKAIKGTGSVIIAKFDLTTKASIL